MNTRETLKDEGFAFLTYHALPSALYNIDLMSMKLEIDIFFIINTTKKIVNNIFGKII